eukprot:gene9936-2118_t
MARLDNGWRTGAFTRHRWQFNRSSRCVLTGWNVFPSSDLSGMKIVGAHASFHESAANLDQHHISVALRD